MTQDFWENLYQVEIFFQYIIVYLIKIMQDYPDDSWPWSYSVLYFQHLSGVILPDQSDPRYCSNVL